MSMLLVATEIVAYLIVAALLGFVAAWALRGALQRDRRQSAQGAATETAGNDAQLTALLAQREAELVLLQQRLAALEQATHAASSPVLHAEHYGEIPRFLEQLGIGLVRTTAHAARDAYVGATGNLFEDDAAPSPPPTLVRDDLKKVRGIGPKFERMLNGLGVQSFKQIALWREEDIVRYARELHTFPERVHRDDWVRSAREQHLLKYGERL